MGLSQGISNPTVLYVSADPSGACGPAYITVNRSTGAIYGCVLSLWTPIGGGGGGGSVNSVSFTGGLISVANPTTTPALTVAGTSGGLVYFSGAATWASSGAMAAGQFVLGGGVGSAPTTSFSVVPLANGGTNAALTASAGGIFYSTGSAGAILAGTATARQMLQSGASAAPTWSTTTWPATTTINRILFSSSANVIGEITTANGGIVNASSGGVPSVTVTPVLGLAGTSAGTMGFSGVTSGVVTIQTAAAAGTWSLTLPTSGGSSGQFLQTNGSGVTVWATVSGSGTVTVVGAGALCSTCLVTGGGTTTIQTANTSATMDSSGNVSTPGNLAIGVGSSVGGVTMYGQGTATTAATSSVGWMAPASVTTAFNMKLPAAPVTGYLLNTGTSDPSTITFVPTITVATGGTSLTTLTIHALYVGNGTSAPTALSVGATNTVLLGSTGADPAFGAVPLAAHATQAADTVVANASGSTASPTAVSIGSCSAASSALTYNTSTHAFGCNTISGSGTVNAGTAGQFAYYASSTTAVSGNANFTISGSDITAGVAGSAVGTLSFANATSGTIKFSPTTGALGSITITLPAFTGTAVVAATSTTTTQALFATATGGAPAFRALVAGDLPTTLTSGTAITNAALTTPAIGAATGASVVLTGSLTSNALTSGRVTFAGASGILVDDTDMTFATDTLTVTKIVGSTSITDTGLTAGRVTFAGTAGLLSDDADMTFATDTLTITKVVASTSLTVAGAAITNNVVQNSESANYTTVLTDAGKHLYHPSADTTARTFTIDSNANVAYPIGTTITFVNDTSGGVITIAITSDTLVLAGAGSTGSRSLAASGVATALKITSTRWIINGTGLT